MSVGTLLLVCFCCQASHVSFNFPLFWWTRLCARDVLCYALLLRVIRTYHQHGRDFTIIKFFKSRSRVAVSSESSLKFVWVGYLQHYEVCWCTRSASQAARHSHIWSCRRIDPLLQMLLTRPVEHWPVLNRTLFSTAPMCFGKLLQRCMVHVNV
jgi:hypothetical protein